MPILSTPFTTSQTISYTEWKDRSFNNRVRYFEFGTPTEYYAAFGKLGMILITKITDTADITDFETNVKPDAIAMTSEIEMYELAASDSLIGALDGRQQKAYDFSSTVLYTGYAEFGVSTASTGWTIKKLTLDASGNPTSEKWTGVGVATWTNRLSETYS